MPEAKTYRRGTGGTVPPTNLRWGTAHASVTPDILRSSVVGCARKYEQSKKGVIKEFFSEIVVVLVRKGSYTTLNIVKDTENLGKERGKIRKTWSMSKKKVIRNFGCENENFFRKNVIQKSWSAKIFRRPPNPAPGLRHCLIHATKLWLEEPVRSTANIASTINSHTHGLTRPIGLSQSVSILIQQ